MLYEHAPVTEFIKCFRFVKRALLSGRNKTKCLCLYQIRYICLLMEQFTQCSIDVYSTESIDKNLQH